MSSCAWLSNYFEKEKQKFQHRSGRSFSDISMFHVQSDLSAAACDICFSVRMRSMPSHVNFYHNAAISCFLLCSFILFCGINTSAKNDPSFYASLEFFIILIRNSARWTLHRADMLTPRSQDKEEKRQR